MRPRLLGIYLLFFLSGTAGLIYQVIWVRQFGNFFGNTVHSAALVTAVFMTGLGVGSLLAGLWSDQKYGRNPDSLLKAYAYFELGIAIFGQLLAFALPKFESLAAAYSSYVPTQEGWYAVSLGSEFFTHTLAVVVLLPITTLMGGTLSLLIRHLVRSDLTIAGRRVGMLYGINTAGAAAGAFLVDFALVPKFGLMASQSVAIFLNLGVGLTALIWASRQAAGVAPRRNRAGVAPRRNRAGVAPRRNRAGAPAAQSRLHSEVSRARLTRPVLMTGLAICLSGFACMGMEILWFRFLISVLGTYRATLSLLLTVILIGIWLGSTLGGATPRRWGHPALLFAVVQGLFAVVALALFAVFADIKAVDPAIVNTWANASDSMRPLVEVWTKLRVILMVVGVPALLMGFSYPLANRNVQRAEASVGTRAGVLYLANTLGAVAGALLTGFVFLPALGMQLTALVLAACSVVTAVPLLLSMTSAPATGNRRWALLVVAIGAVSVLLWGLLPGDFLLRHRYQPNTADEQILVFSEDVNETVWVTEDSGNGTRRLYTNGHSMSGTGYRSQRYMRAFVHLPLLQIAEPRKVLVICFGVGNTLHAASLHPTIEQLEVVDLSRNVLRHAGYFERWNHQVLTNPKVRVFINDGRQHLRMQPPGTYDLITLEPPPLAFAGVSSLYSTEFYRLAKEGLRPGGYLTQWLPAYQVPASVLASAIRSFIDVFPQAVLLSGYRDEYILIGSRDGPAQFDPLQVKHALSTRQQVRSDLAEIDLSRLIELLGTYIGSAAALELTAGEALPITDDLPIMEYTTLGFPGYIVPVIPITLYDIASVDQWCPGCFVAGSGMMAGELGDLFTYLALATEHAFAQRPDARLSDSGSVSTPPLSPRPNPDPEQAAAIRSESGYLQQLGPP